MASVDDDIFLIRQLLAWAGANPSQAARRIGVANTTLNRFANGSARSRIGRETLEKLRTAYPDFPAFQSVTPGPDATGATGSIPLFGATFTTINIDDTVIEQVALGREPIDALPKPALLRRHPGVIACHVQGSSMRPALREGELIAIAPAADVTSGDLVAVWLTPAAGTEERTVLLKELVRRSARAVELREYDPSRVVAIPNVRVDRIDRILSRGDLLRDYA